MRKNWFLASVVILTSVAFLDAQEKSAPKKDLKYKWLDDHHKKQELDPANLEQIEVLVHALKMGEVDHLEMVKTPSPLALAADLGVWAIVVFLGLLFILRKMAWGPMLEGLQKREQTIKDAVEEAKKARAETLRVTTQFREEMAQKMAEIPRIMEEARKDAEGLKEEMRAETAKEIQTERQRLRREIDTARDQALQELWNQAAQLATLISTKAIGRSLSEDDHRRLIDEATAEIQSQGKRR